VSKNVIGRIKEALGPERALVFLETVNALDLGPEDPELLLAAANASMVVSLAEIPGQIVAGREHLEALFARFLQDVDLRIAESMTTAVDEMATEVRTMARELALGEYSAAAALRATAIMDEVRALRGATAELERERQAAQARDIAAETSASAAEGGRAAAVPGAPTMTPKAFGILVVAVVLGMYLGAFLTKRSYQDWRPPPPHSAEGANRSTHAVRSGREGPLCGGCPPYISEVRVAVGVHAEQ
jgi:hypothetical protein